MTQSAGISIASSTREEFNVSNRTLFLASTAALFFELLVIRYISTEILLFTTLKNLPLIASFFGIGLGMLRGEATPGAKHRFPLVAAALFLAARFSSHLPLPVVSWNYVIVSDTSRLWSVLAYLAITLTVLWLIADFFSLLGALVGESLKQLQPLPAYGINLAGSLAGMLLFTLLSFLHTPPGVWFAAGFALLLPFFWRRWFSVALFAALVGAAAISGGNTYWSPYHRIDLKPLWTPGWSRPAAYSLLYNHAWYQSMVDLSPEFLAQHAAAEPNRSMRGYYELPYEFVLHPRNVLVVGSGTGNDVAAALRHGAEHVDAVEIDPVILNLGRRYHPERPYASPRVTAYVNDARAFFRQAPRKYDLIVFGFLDSSTLLTGFSSIRLDNYVYTRESFAAARNLLTPDGTMVVAFATVRSFVADRLYATLAQAFDKEPRAFLTNTTVWGIVYVEGKAREAVEPRGNEITSDLRSTSGNALVATDYWPFLYLERRRIPGPLVMALLLFLLSVWVFQRKLVRRHWDVRQAGFFLLGAGFLLLETKAVTQMSLLFGSTWIVNAVVISAFLMMALLANLLAMRVTLNLRWCYFALLLLVALGIVLPYSLLVGASVPIKVIVAALWAALPVFFSGAIFSSEFRHAPCPPAALGVNLMGAVLGGVLENTVMVGGSIAVGSLALVIYAAAWLCSARTGSITQR